jgi:4-hydroxy-tetrahydrodipicolinate synthase
MSSGKYDTKYDRLYVALLTPFKDNFDVDEAALRKFLRYFMQNKFVEAGGALIINPEAGETFYLSREEKRRNVEITMEECGGKVPVFAGVVDLRTEDSVKVAVDAKERGVDGLFLIPPMGSSDITLNWDADRYPEVWIDMAKAQLRAADLPAITHPSAPFSQVYGKGLPLNATLQMCREIPNIVGWKCFQSYQGFLLIARALRTQLDRHVAILPSSAWLFHENLATGNFDGSVSGSFCYAMEPMIDHIDAWKNKDIDQARRIWNSGLANLHYYIYFDSARLHTRYKAAAWLRGLIPSPFMRPPQPKPRKEEVRMLINLLTGAGLNVIPEQDSNRVIAQLPL